MMFWSNAQLAFWQALLLWADMILFSGLLIWVIYALVTGKTRNPSSRASSSAREILDQRLARGEICEAEYQRQCDLIARRDQRDPASADSAPG